MATRFWQCCPRQIVFWLLSFITCIATFSPWSVGQVMAGSPSTETENVEPGEETPHLSHDRHLHRHGVAGHREQQVIGQREESGGLSGSHRDAASLSIGAFC